MKMNRFIKKALVLAVVFATSSGAFAQSMDEGQVDVSIKEYLKTAVSGDTALTVNNVTWETTEDNLGNEIEAAYFNGNASWLTIADKPLSATTDISGFTISFTAKFEKSSDWSRIIDINNRSTMNSNFSETVGNYLFLNLGAGKQSATNGIYDQQTFEIAYAYPGRNTEARSAYFNHGESAGSRTNPNLKKGITTDVELTGTTAPISSVNDLYGKWHEFKLIVARTGYSTLVVDGKPLVWIEASATNSASITNVVTNLKTVRNGVYDFPDYYVGKSPYGDGDGFVKGYMKNLTFKCKADMYWVEDPSDEDGGYWTDGADVTRTEKFYAIDFVTNGGSSCSQLVVSKVPTLPTPVLTGFDFGGWYTDADFTTPAPAAGTKMTGALKLYAKWSHASHDGLNFTVWTSNTSLPTTAGTYVLSQNVQLSSTWTVPSGTVYLDLNGSRISTTSTTAAIISVPSTSELHILDCNSLNKTYIFATNDGQWTINSSDGTEQINGGIIYGSSATAIKNAGKLYLEGGSIVGNKSSGSAFGAGIHNTGTLTISGGAVIGNTATNGAGVYNYSGTMNITGGQITKNKATNGAGVYNAATLNVGGNAYIYENTSSNVSLSGTKKITVTSAFGSSAKIGVSISSSTNPLVITSGCGTCNPTLNVIPIFRSDNSSLKVMYMKGEIYLMKRKAAW